MNVLRILTPCVLQRRRIRGIDNTDKRDSWFMRRQLGDASHMTHRMGASASSSITSVGGDSVQAARLSASSSPEQHGIAVRYIINVLYIYNIYIIGYVPFGACFHSARIISSLFNI